MSEVKSKKTLTVDEIRDRIELVVLISIFATSVFALTP